MIGRRLKKRNRLSLERRIGWGGGGVGGEACICAATLISVSLLVNIVCGLDHWMSL